MSVSSITSPSNTILVSSPTGAVDIDVNNNLNIQSIAASTTLTSTGSLISNVTTINSVLSCNSIINVHDNLSSYNAGLFK